MGRWSELSGGFSILLALSACKSSNSAIQAGPAAGSFASTAASSSSSSTASSTANSSAGSTNSSSVSVSNLSSIPAGGLVLLQGQSIAIVDLTLVMQPDANLVIYKGATALWSSETGGRSCGANQCEAVFQSDGNFVVYEGATPLWNSQTASNPTAHLVLSATAPYIEVESATNSVLWASSAIVVAGTSGSTTMGSSTSLLASGVSASDFTLAPVSQTLGPINAPIWGYEMQYNGPANGYGANTQVPMFMPYNRDVSQWWDEALDELLYSRTPVVLLHGRGCNDPNNAQSGGAGNMCPLLLSNMVSAVNRAGANNAIRFGMWVDTGALPNARYNQLYPNGGPSYPNGFPAFDMSNAADAAGRNATWYFWDANIRPWFDTVPRDLWYLYNDHGTMKPVIAFWSLSSYFFSNQPNNARILLEDIRTYFQNTYGMTPFFDVDSSWIDTDPSIAKEAGLVGAVNGWFVAQAGTPSGAYTVTNWAGENWGAMVPGFINGNNAIGCGAPCHEVERNNGETFITTFEANRSSAFNIVEGIDDTLEGNGSYRSDGPGWPYANRYLNIIREYSDPETVSIRFQAESADTYLNATNKPATQFRYNKALGIVPLGAADQGIGWALGSTTAGEALQYNQVLLSNGFYKFTARVSAVSSGNTVHFSIDGVNLPSVSVPDTASMDTYAVINLGSSFVPAGHHDLKLTLETDNVNVDWFFSKKLWPSSGSQQLLTLATDSIGNSTGARFKAGNKLSIATLTTYTGNYLSANDGGGMSASATTQPVIFSDRTSVGTWEQFGIIPVNAGQALQNGSEVMIETSGGRYLTAESAGGIQGHGSLSTNRSVAGGWEYFYLVKVSGSSGNTIQNGDKIAIRTGDGVHYVTAENGGGNNLLDTNRTQIGLWEQYTVHFLNQYSN
jgi:hypothetical protein